MSGVESAGAFRAPVVGMVGAGQLARMTHQASVDLGVDLVVLAKSPEDPAVLAGARALYGRADDPEALARLAGLADVVTFDHEQVPNDLVVSLEGSGVAVAPGSRALNAAQDKLAARRLFSEAGLDVPAFAQVGPDARSDIESFAAAHGWPVVLKARTGGYDGRGVAFVAGPSGVDAALSSLRGADLLVEAHVELACEVAVLAARSTNGEYAAYPTVATLQEDGICTQLSMPASLDPQVRLRAHDLARSVADLVGATGIIAVELFVEPSGTVLINEIAVRPHNSGHATIEGCVTSQFHNHLRAVLGWPLGDTSLVKGAAAMVNVLGGADGVDPRSRLLDALTVRGASVHFYAKAALPGRKVGHVTALGEDPSEAVATARRCAWILGGA